MLQLSQLQSKPSPRTPKAPDAGAEVVSVKRPTGVLRIKVLRSLSGRLFGPLSLNRMPANQGLLILPCRSIHTFGLQTPSDVLFLDEDGRILEIWARVAPWRKLRCADASAALGLSAGIAGYAGLHEGERLRELSRIINPRRRTRRPVVEQLSQL